jgi:hypothetical protein
MKTKVECTGCEITIEEVDGKCVVIAEKDGEVVEEFSIDCEAEELPEEGEDQEEMEEEEQEEQEEMEMEEEDEAIEEAVKNFESYFGKK